MIRTYNNVHVNVYDSPIVDQPGAPFTDTRAWFIQPPSPHPAGLPHYAPPRIGPFLEEEIALSVAADYFAYQSCPHGNVYEADGPCPACHDEDRSDRDYHYRKENPE